MNRRSFVKFAGLAGLAKSLLGSDNAEAATWQKLPIPAGLVRLPQNHGRVRRSVANGVMSASSLVIRSDGTVFGCGYNVYSQLGTNTTTTKKTFVSAIGISNIVSVAIGQRNSAVLRSDGTVFACGYNGYGQAGDSSTTNRSTFVSCIGVSNAIAIAAGASHTIALRADGVMLACGGNGFGQFGDNTTTSRLTFVSSIGV